MLEIEKADWKPFRNALDKSEIKEFDEMFYISRLYLSTRSNSVQLVSLQPIIMSILFHHYMELKKCINHVEQIEAKVNNSSKKKIDMIKKKEGEYLSLKRQSILS